MDFNLAKKLYPYLASLLLFVVALIFMMGLQQNYEDSRYNHRRLKVEYLSYEFSNTFREMILSRTKNLEILAQSDLLVFGKDEARFHRDAEVIQQTVSGFAAINWVAPDGTIRWVHPVAANQNAVGRNVLYSEVVGQYLADARDKHETQVSHAVSLYQGGKGFTIYSPIYDNKGTFLGWINGVIRYQSFLDDFLKTYEFKKIHVLLHWDLDPENYYEYSKPIRSEIQTSIHFKVLNQNLEVLVELHPNEYEIKQEVVFRVFYYSALIAIFAAAFFFFLTLKKQQQMKVQNQSLRFNHRLLSLLCHDLSNPIMVIEERLFLLKKKIPEEVIPEVDKILKAARSQSELLKMTRGLHSVDIGSKSLNIAAVDLLEVVQSCIRNNESKIKEKTIQIIIQIPSNIPKVLADFLTLEFNVLNNILTNAIKFSKYGDIIDIRAGLEKELVYLEIQDHGVGISRERIEKIIQEQQDISTVGTFGESGSGLGLLQVFSFMKYYGGQAHIKSTNGTTLRLYFERA